MHALTTPLRRTTGRDERFLEACLGPVGGFHLACYTVPAPEGGSIGYAKLYAFQPQDAWDTVPALDKYASGPWPHAADAMRGVLQLSYLLLEGRRPPADALAACAARFG